MKIIKGKVIVNKLNISLNLKGLLNNLVFSNNQYTDIQPISLLQIHRFVPNMLFATNLEVCILYLRSSASFLVAITTSAGLEEHTLHCTNVTLCIELQTDCVVDWAWVQVSRAGQELIVQVLLTELQYNYCCRESEIDNNEERDDVGLWESECTAHCVQVGGEGWYREGCSRLNVAYSQSTAQQGSTVDSFIIQFSHYIARLF